MCLFSVDAIKKNTAGSSLMNLLLHTQYREVCFSFVCQALLVNSAEQLEMAHGNTKATLSKLHLRNTHSSTFNNICS